MYMNNICKRETCNTKTMREKLVMLTEKYTERVGEEQQKTIIIKNKFKWEKKGRSTPHPPPPKKEFIL